MAMSRLMTERGSLAQGAIARKMAALGVLGGLLALGGAVATQAEEVTKTFTVSGHARVKVETDDGAVRVSTGDIKQVEVRVIYSGYKLDQDLRVGATQSGDSVEVVAKTSSKWGFRWASGHSSLRVELHMPKDADLTVNTGDGSVEAESINGNLDVHTGDGSIAVQGAKGDVRLRTGDGSITGRDLDGRVDATTGDRSVNLEGRFDGLNIKSGDGSVTARAHG